MPSPPGDIEADPVADAVLSFLQGWPGPEWVGSASELLVAINPSCKRGSGLPTAANRLSHELARAEPILLHAGWGVVRDRAESRDRTRLLVLRRLAP